jgi:hypothetical protein
MGLLERALQYKQQLNISGKETLIDKIKGPAESDYLKQIDIGEIDSFPALDEKDAISKNETRYINDSNIQNAITEQIEEDIVLLDDDLPAVKNEFSEHDPIVSELSHLFVEAEDKITEINSSDSEIKQDTELITHSAGKGIEKTDNFGVPEFNDYSVLYEIQKEMINVESVEEVYSIILFSIMGQLGVSSASIISPSFEDDKKWKVVDSHGIKISEEDLFWKLDEGILQLLNKYRGILDIEDIKNDNNLRDDYYKFTAIDARIISPLLKNNNLIGAILVGEKINSEEFTPDESEFLQALSDISSTVIASIIKYEKLATELIGFRIEQEILSDVEYIQDSILKTLSVDELNEVIRKNFYSLGIESYALFITDEISKDYYPAYFEADDLLVFGNSGFKIKKENRLVTFLLNKRSSIILENFQESNVIIETFGRERIAKMDLFIAYPFIVSGKLSGFITLFKINPAVNIIDIDIRIQKINRFLFPYLHRVYELDPERNKYSDSTDILFNRIENEFKHAQELNIPVSIVLITIKNFKRFYDRFGKIELKKLTNTTAEVIKKRLTDGDFSARVDRHKFLLILPGKDKRYSIMLSNMIKKEIIQNYDMFDFKLLIT